jgi:hypothetical protein
MPNAVKRQVESWWFVLESEKTLPPDKQSRFLLKPLTQAERLRVWDDYKWVSVDPQGGRSITPRAMQQAEQLVLSNLLETQNFPLDNPITWPASGGLEAKRKYLEMLDDMDVVEIGNAIV